MKSVHRQGLAFAFAVLATCPVALATPQDQVLTFAPIGEVRTLPGPDAVYDVVAITRDGTRIAAGDAAPGHNGFIHVDGKDDGVVRVWDTRGDGPAREFRGRNLKVEAVAISPDGGRVAASGPTRRIKLEGFAHLDPEVTVTDGVILQTWDVASGRQLAAIEPVGTIYGLAFDPGGATIAAVLFGDEAELAVWEADGGRSIRQIGGPGKPMRGMLGRGPEVVFEFGRGLRRVAALDLLRYNTVRLWGPESEQFGDLKWDGKHNIDGCALSPDDQAVAIIDAEQVVTIATTKDRAVQRSGQRPVPPEPGPFVTYPDSKIRPLVLAYDPTGARIVVGVADGSLRIYDPATAEVVAVVRGPAAPVRALAFVGDRIRVVAGGWSIPINTQLELTPLVVWEARPPKAP